MVDVHALPALVEALVGPDILHVNDVSDSNKSVKVTFDQIATLMALIITDLPQASVDGLVAALGNKAPLVHTHVIGDTTGLQTALDTKIDAISNAGASGSSVLREITGQTIVARKILAGANVTVTENADDITIASTGGGGGVTDHGALTGLGDNDHPQYELAANKNQINGYAGLDGSGNVPGTRMTYGSAADTVCVGNDARLSDTRIPTDNSVSTAKIQSGAVDNGKLASMDADLIKGRLTSSGSPQDLTPAQVNTILPVFTDSLKGLVPASGGGTVNFLRADGSFANPLKSESFIIAASDETTLLTTGTAKATFRMPYAFTVTEVRASLTTAGTGAALVTVDINESGTSILSTKLTIDATEKTSETATTPAVISDTALADDAEITIDIDTIDTDNVATGLKVTIIGTR